MQTTISLPYLRSLNGKSSPQNEIAWDDPLVQKLRSDATVELILQQNPAFKVNVVVASITSFLERFLPHAQPDPERMNGQYQRAVNTIICDVEAYYNNLAQRRAQYENRRGTKHWGNALPWQNSSWRPVYWKPSPITGGNTTSTRQTASIQLDALSSSTPRVENYHQGISFPALDTRVESFEQALSGLSKPRSSQPYQASKRPNLAW